MGNNSSPPPRGVSWIMLTGLCKLSLPHCNETTHFIARKKLNMSQITRKWNFYSTRPNSTTASFDRFQIFFLSDTFRNHEHERKYTNECNCENKSEQLTVHLVEYLTGYQRMLGSSPSPKSMILLFKLLVLVKTCHCRCSFIFFNMHSTVNKWYDSFTLIFFLFDY
jgi:hypothetical protein